MTDIDDQGRTEPPLNANELQTLLGFLDYQRQTLEWKCEGLGKAELQTTVGSSSMTLGGLLKHLALVEDLWTARMHGTARPDPWDAIDWSLTPNWDFDSAQNDSPEELRTFWKRSVRRSQDLIDLAVAADGLDGMAEAEPSDSRRPSLRWILIHMIEEYARHNGHADLLREAIDGETGE